ncbi:hypothetical protein B0H11DRAFT_130433 [Mycena galericulata]|nr:hypothetical protein B0H11DRAFT_130433 [Mycena galericulata]
MSYNRGQEPRHTHQVPGSTDLIRTSPEGNPSHTRLLSSRAKGLLLHRSRAWFTDMHSETSPIENAITSSIPRRLCSLCLALIVLRILRSKVLCLLYLVLRSHKKIINFASHLVLEDMEFEMMVECVENIAQTRFRNLLEGWQQQRIDTKLQACTAIRDCSPRILKFCSDRVFPGGMFEAWHEGPHLDCFPPFPSRLAIQNFMITSLIRTLIGVPGWTHPTTSSSRRRSVPRTRKMRRTEGRRKDILLYGVPPQPSRAETQKLRKELEEKKAKRKLRQRPRGRHLFLSQTVIAMQPRVTSIIGPRPKDYISPPAMGTTLTARSPRPKDRSNTTSTVTTRTLSCGTQIKIPTRPARQTLLCRTV